MKKIWMLSITTLVVLFSSGCSLNTQPKVPKKVKKIVVVKPLKLKEQSYPVIKENNPSQKAVVDMGVVLKTKITAYKDNRGDLIASHNIFFWAKDPGFITTNTLPKKKLPNRYEGFKIDLNKKGLVDLDKDRTQESIRTQNNYTNDKKILEFLKKEIEQKGK